MAWLILSSDGHIIDADQVMHDLHRRAGGEPGDVFAYPALADLAALSGSLGLKLSRPVFLVEKRQVHDLWVNALPDKGHIRLDIMEWRRREVSSADEWGFEREDEIERSLAQAVLVLDSHQRLLAWHWPDQEPDGEDAILALQQARGTPWQHLVADDDAAIGEKNILPWHSVRRVPVNLGTALGDWIATQLAVRNVDGEIIGFEVLLRRPEQEDGSPAECGDMSGFVLDHRVTELLKQPINRIIASAETIGNRMQGPLRSDYVGYAGDIAAAGRHLQELVTDLADLQAVEANGFSVNRDEIDLADIARRAGGLLTIKADEKRITIDAPKADEEAPAWGEFRRALQIALNLVTNAIRYSPVDSEIWLRLEQENGWAQLVVADQGPGISAEDADRIFTKFERLGRSGDGGSGLGLYISRKLARAMGGELTLESAEGQGARFILSLPLRTQNETPG